MDIVYVLGRGSLFDNLELRYSLRSIEKFIAGFGTVYIVGERPPWIRNVIHLPFPDRHRCKEWNIKEKVEVACYLPQVSQKFLHLHDDHFCLAPCEAHKVPYYAGSSLQAAAESIKPSNIYRKAVTNTAEALGARGHRVFNFDIHTPIIYDKTAFLHVENSFDWSKPGGYVVKSLYANSLGIEPVILPDLKIKQALPLYAVVAHLAGRPWWSLGNGGLTDKMRALLAELYPVKSRFE